MTLTNCSYNRYKEATTATQPQSQQHKITDHLPDCVCLPSEQKTAQVDKQKNPKILENVLDISATIGSILETCGIEKVKANKAVGSITHAFIHFDEKLLPGTTGAVACCKTRHLRKDDLQQRLQRECCMNPQEAKLATSVVKCAFRAFYHKQSLRKYDAGYYSEDDWQTAAQNTIVAYAKTGATKSELQLAERRIQDAYKGYMNRVSTKKTPYTDDSGNDAWRRDSFTCSRKNNFLDSIFGDEFGSAAGRSKGPCQRESTQHGCPYQKENSRQQIGGPCGRMQQNVPASSPHQCHYLGTPCNHQQDGPCQRPGTDFKQVVCTCCRCVKASPASYRDSRGRSIILMEDNEIYYNAQQMKQDMLNLKASLGKKMFGDEAVSDGDVCPNTFCRTMVDLARQVVSRALNEHLSDLNCAGATANSEPRTSADSQQPDQISFVGKPCPLNSNKNCVCKKRKAKVEVDDELGVQTPPNSIDGGLQFRGKLEDRDIVEILLRGVCQKRNDGRTSFNFIGLKFRNADQITEFACTPGTMSEHQHTQTRKDDECSTSRSEFSTECPSSDTIIGSNEINPKQMNNEMMESAHEKRTTINVDSESVPDKFIDDPAADVESLKVLHQKNHSQTPSRTSHATHTSVAAAGTTIGAGDGEDNVVEIEVQIQEELLPPSEHNDAAKPDTAPAETVEKPEDGEIVGEVKVEPEE